MQRGLRLIRVGLAAVLLLVCLGATTLWVRSYWVMDSAGHDWSNAADKRMGSWMAATSRGWMKIAWHDVNAEDPTGVVTVTPRSHWRYDRIAPPPIEAIDAASGVDDPDSLPASGPAEQGAGAVGALGVTYDSRHFTFASIRPDQLDLPPSQRTVAVQAWRQSELTLPLAYIAALTAIPPAIALNARRKRKRG